MQSAIKKGSVLGMPFTRTGRLLVVVPTMMNRFPFHQIQRFNLSWIKKGKFMVTGSLHLFRRAIHGMCHDGKLFRDDHDAFAVFSSLDNPAAQLTLMPESDLPDGLEGPASRHASK